MSKRSEEFRSLSTPARGLAGFVQRAARVSGRRPKTAIALWLALIVGLIAAGSMTGTRELKGPETSVGETRVAEQILADAGLQDPAVESVMVRTDDPGQSSSLATELAGELRTVRGVERVSEPGDPGLSAEGGNIQLLQVQLRGDPEGAAADRAAAVANRVDRFAADHPEAQLHQSGAASLENAISTVVEDDLTRVELISIPLILVILLIAFGAFVAALVPLILGVTAVAGALGAAGLVSQIAPDSGTTASLVVLIGLAVGVDYSLFYIRREREERVRGNDSVAALDAAAATVGRAVVVSGMTVIVALAGLLVTGMSVFTSLALGTMVVVLLSVVGSITVLPAVLSLLGDRVERGRVPIVGRLRGRVAPRFWPRLTALVARRPVTSLIASLCVLGALAVPALDMHLGETTSADLPDDVPAVVSLRAIEGAFPGAPSSAELVVEGEDLDSPAARTALAELGERGLAATGGSGNPAVEVAPNGDAASVSVPMPEMSRDESTRTVAELRNRVAPTFEEGRVLVTGDAADSGDFTDALRGSMPLVIGIVLALAFLLLVAAFGSPRLALTVIGLNLLSVAAAYGVLTAVFQFGWGEGHLGLIASGSIVPWVPLFAFVILFGLSMDYTVIVLERIRESRVNGLDARQAVAEGVGATAGAVTSAAVVMVAVFSLFAMLRLPEMQQLGVGLGAAILIDATLVRGVALPAAVALLGERGWRVRPRRRRRAIIDHGREPSLRTAHDR